MPEGAFERRVAALLFCWAIEGWLLPTLLLIRSDAHHNPWPAAASGDASLQQPLQGKVVAVWSRLGVILFTQLSKLLPAPQQQPQRHSERERESGGDCVSTAPAGMLLVLRWWLVLVSTWAVCCCAAPMFEQLPPTQLPPPTS